GGIAIVYGFHGLGIWICGADAYMGRGWGDQVNYDVISHSLMHYSVGTMPPATDPSAVVGQGYVVSRHGQSVLQGFMAQILDLDPKILFEPVIVLFPCLIFVTFLDLFQLKG